MNDGDRLPAMIPSSMVPAVLKDAISSRCAACWWCALYTSASRSVVFMQRCTSNAIFVYLLHSVHGAYLLVTL